MGSVLMSLIGLATPAYAGTPAMGLELAAIRMIESSGGINTNHRLITKGMNANTRAGGEFGLLPITARDLVVKSARLNSLYPQIEFMDNDAITDILNNDKEFDLALASYMWGKYRRTMNPDQAACAWFRGPNAKVCMDQEFVNNDSYVQKFRDYKFEIQSSMIAGN